MDSAKIAGRGVGPTLRASLPSRGRLQAMGVALVVLGAALPATALQAREGYEPPATALVTAGQANAVNASAVSASALGAGSDQLASLQRSLRRVEAQLENARTRVSTLTIRRDGTASDLRGARSRSAQARTGLAAARKDLAKADRADKRAAKDHATIKARAKAARADFAGAEAAMAAVQSQLDSLVAKSDKAATRATRASSKVKKAAAGSAARRKAFTQWQMAAVEARSAHARRVLVEDRAADLFVTKEGSEATLMTAESALAESDRTVARAQAARTSAARRVSDLSQERKTARAEVATLATTLKATESALARAVRSVKKLTSQRTDLRRRIEDLEGRLATSGVGVASAAAGPTAGVVR